jgi:hypothetical protein
MLILNKWLQNQDPLIFCIVNVNETAFARSLWTQGFQGGKAAVQQIIKAVADHLSDEGVQTFGRLSFWITLFFSKTELDSLLVNNGICTQDQLDAFLSVRLNPFCLFPR